MSISHAAWTHGHSVNAERPELAASIRREGSRASIELGPGDNWLHFAVPTPVIVNDHRLRAESVLLNFSTGDGTFIKAVHVYDGDNLIARFDGVNLDSGPGVWRMERWRLPSTPEVFLAIGISINATYGIDARTRPGAVDRHILFGAAGCDFVA